ncbi:MAG: hypothetical protein ACJ79Y_16205, partial [Myxococcales bacterium]
MSAMLANVPAICFQFMRELSKVSGDESDPRIPGASERNLQNPPESDLGYIRVQDRRPLHL